MVFLQFEKSLAINVHSVRKEAFFRFLYYCIISIGCWVIVGQSVKGDKSKKIRKMSEVLNFTP